MRIAAAAAAALLVALAGCSAANPEDGERGAASPTGQSSPRRVEQLRVHVLERLPHDREAFTQGLEVADGGVLYEGTGLEGRSSVRRGPIGAEPTTRVDLPASLFGEGLTLVGPRLWQLTWRDGIAFERDAKTLAERSRVRYEGEGWGLCHDAGRDRLVMSDGSARLTFRDPGTFRRTGGVDVARDGRPVGRLNELECTDDGSVYANVYRTDTIVRIDPDSGAVTAEVDASGLLRPGESEGAGVLNGVAALPGTDEFLVTGKLWPRMFRVEFVPAR